MSSQSPNQPSMGQVAAKLPVARPSKAISRAIAFAIVIATLVAAAYLVFIRGPSEAINEARRVAKQIAGDIDEVFHFRPRIVSQGLTIVEAGGAIDEWALIERRFTHELLIEETRLGSSKRIRLRGHFVGKAGYVVSGAGLENPFSLEIGEDGKSITAIIPDAKVHSMELTKIEILEDQGGWWNRINAEDRENAHNTLLAEARAALEDSEILDEVEGEMVRRLQEVIRRSQPELEVHTLPLL